MNTKTPIFHDTTLRDGNQSLAKPWNTDEKIQIYDIIRSMNISCIEIGFPSAGQLDFESCRALSDHAGSSETVTALTRAVEKDITTTVDALKGAHNPRVHIVLALSPFTMEHMLRKTPSAVREMAVKSVTHAKKLLGSHGQVQFTAEHFGDCIENLDFVKDVFKACVNAGADVINMPNTVERYRPSLFTEMVSKVIDMLPDNVIASVHCHNDLGMATATSVESYFAGAVQIETCLNGIGERAGNANFYEIAAVLENCGVRTGINMSSFFDAAKTIANLSCVPIHRKAPLFGSDVVIHRSGIHQDGAMKTKNMSKGAYRPIDFNIIGRNQSDVIGFTSQSGSSALKDTLTSHGFSLDGIDINRFTTECKSISEKYGELSSDDVINFFTKYKKSLSEPQH